MRRVITEHSGLVIAQRGDLKVIQCKECGWNHIDPLPDAQQIANYYRDDYYGTDIWFKKEQDEHDQGLWDAAYRFQANLLYDRDDISQDILDWGCGAGFFVKWFNENCEPICFGIDPNIFARQYMSSGLVFSDVMNVPGSTYYKYNHRASLLFEHLVDPVSVLYQMKRYMRRKLLVIVPHDGPTNPLQARLNTTHWLDKNHINYFSPQGLENLLIKASLKVTWRGATFPMELWCLREETNYLKHPEVGKKCHLARLQFEKRLGSMAFRLYHLLFSRLRWGRELMYMAEIL